jgi:dTDP-4-amino-4,6-dideoxygalactose transaminase
MTISTVDLRPMLAALGARFAVTAGSGTAAIELGIRAAGLAESGAEVVVPALTSPYTAQAILAAGCRPQFADVHPETLLLDAEDAEARVRKRAGAPLPVAEQACREVLSLPLWPYMPLTAVEEVAERVRQFYSAA